MATTKRRLAPAEQPTSVSTDARGVCLLLFMPLRLGTVANLGTHPREYVAWGWAVNGFASVVGAVLSTILAMTFGFGAVLVLALFLYLGALATLPTLLPPRRTFDAPVAERVLTSTSS